MYNYRYFINRVTIIWWWISQCSKVIRIHGSSVIKAILREPRFPDILAILPGHVLGIPFRKVSSTFHWEPSFNFVTLELIARTAIIVLWSERLWKVSGESYCLEVSFFCCVPFSSTVCTDCGYCLSAIVLV